VIGIRVQNPPKVIDELAKKKWKIGYDPHNDCLRLVVMPHVKKRLINMFITDLTKVVSC
jgi:hypothetical protein